jgi:superfamily I DNA/RNA helicase
LLAETILEGLNPEQRRAVESTEGPLLVLAGAGSGKTRVLTSRIAYLIGVCGIPPESMLAVTFTNKAAGEMRERVAKLLGEEQARELSIGTFHSMCVRILRREIGHLERSRGFVIYDDSDSLGVIKDVLKRHGLDPTAGQVAESNGPRAILIGHVDQAHAKIGCFPPTQVSSQSKMAESTNCIARTCRPRRPDGTPPTEFLRSRGLP